MIEIKSSGVGSRLRAASVSLLMGILLIAAKTGLATNGVPCDTSWPTFQCDNSRSGASVNTVILPLGVKWEFTAMKTSSPTG